jgi:hypothetical protein
MGRKQKTIIVHLNVRSSELEGFIQYTPDIKEPNPVDTTSRLHFEKYESFQGESKSGFEIHDEETDQIRDALIECNQELHNTNVYPRHSDCACWWDGFPFMNKPVFIPKGLRAKKYGYRESTTRLNLRKPNDENSNQDVSVNETEFNGYEVYGIFCSPECAIAYLNNEGYLDPETRWERVMMLHEMVKRVYNNELEKIRPAMPRWSLKEYGGNLTIQQYRKLHSNPTSVCEVIYPPITAEIPMIRIQTKDVIVKKPTKVIIDDERFAKAERNIQNLQKTQKKKNPPTGGSLASFMNIRYVDSGESQSSSAAAY